MYRNILIPTDGSPRMAKPIENAMYQARASGATVHALYVIDQRAYVVLPEETQGRVIELLQEEGEGAVERVRSVAEELGIEFRSALRQGVPSQTILAYAAEEEIDLIVMGTHGRTGEQERVLGSVAEEVVRNSFVPVLTVRMTDAELEEIDEELPPEEQLRYIE
ncbi:MAG: universal stress protein [Salinigranum sp.]